MKKALGFLRSGSCFNVSYDDEYAETVIAFLDIGIGVIAFKNASVPVRTIEAIEWID